ncbi:MAG: GNAT family N-acetyltransferase [Solirubrobacteraceae bacterium]
MLIETERLVLRPLAMSDLDEFVALHHDPEVVRFVRTLDRAQAEERLRANEREWGERGHGLFAIHDRLGGRLLGRVGLKYWPQFQETEAGWLLDRDAWGQGYATEAAEAGFADCEARRIAFAPQSGRLLYPMAVDPQCSRNGACG